jgi:putative tryptophan/tyrosine transport system substrate-binding protein
MVWPTT